MKSQPTSKELPLKRVSNFIEVIADGRVYRVPIERGRCPNEAEFMRLDRTRGYVDGNVVVVSYLVYQLRETFFPNADLNDLIAMNFRRVPDDSVSTIVH
jgi:hypothetical protein